MNFINVAHAAESSVNTGVNTNAWHAIMSASPVVQLTLIILIILSIWSWKIIFAKKSQLNVVRKANSSFLELFWEARSLDEVYRELKHYKDSNIAEIFKAGYEELRRIADLSKDDSPKALSGIDNISRAIRTVSDNEIAEFEKNLTVLATTGSTGPFIGLFGTVWGIMSAFQKIGATGSANLAVVAPGISEALIATAIGLAAAIPAVMAYNHFISQIKKEELAIDNFNSDFINIVKRNWFNG